MRTTCYPLPVFLLLLLVCGAGAAQKQIPPAVHWDWEVVSTPDFIGPFRGNAPQFRAPVAANSLPNTLAVTQGGEILGKFEVIVTTNGWTVFESALYTSNSEVGRLAKESLMRWRFQPARLDGIPIRVRLRVILSKMANHRSQRTPRFRPVYISRQWRWAAAAERSDPPTRL